MTLLADSEIPDLTARMRRSGLSLSAYALGLVLAWTGPYKS